MEIKIGVLADAANVSRENKLNITGIFNRVQASSFPLTWPCMAIVLRLEAHSSEQGQHQIRMRVADEDGKEIVSINGQFAIPEAQDPGLPITTQFILNVAGASFPHAGTYSFDVLIDGRYEGTIPLYVVGASHK